MRGPHAQKAGTVGVGGRFRAEFFGHSKIATCAHCPAPTRRSCRKCGQPVCRWEDGCAFAHRLAQRPGSTITCPVGGAS